MAFGIDVDWNKPSASTLQSHGVTFVCGYASHDSGKDLTRGYCDKLAAKGISSVVVWETSAGRSTAGYSAGASDAREAEQVAKGFGMPSGRPIYFAVDQDISASSVSSYFQGAASVLGAGRVGVYGSYRVCSGLAKTGHVEWFWQTYAWSGGQWFGGNHIEQYRNEVTLGGMKIDYDRSKKSDYGQWKPGVSPTPQPKPGPVPAPTPAPNLTVPTGTPILKNGSQGQLVKELQEALNHADSAGLTVDGDFGPLTDAGVRHFQSAKRLTVDGEYGPQTAKVLAAALK